MKEHRVYITSAMNGKALTIGDQKDKQSTLYVKKVTKQPSQIFTLQKHKACYVFRHAASKKVIDVYKQKGLIHTDVIAYEYHGKQNQMWKLEEIPNLGYVIINQKSKLCMEIEGGIDADGMVIKQNKNYKYLNQIWKLNVV